MPRCFPTGPTVGFRCQRSWIRKILLTIIGSVCGNERQESELIAQLDRKFLTARPWKLWPRLVAYTLFEGRPLTTRGRWINPIVFAGYRLYSLLPQRAREIAPIFILGVGRSGTTVLGSILSLHKDVGYLNEPKALWQAALGDDDLIGSYSRRSGRYRMDRTDVTYAKRHRLKAFYSVFLRLSGSRRIVDKYPELLFRTDLLYEVFPRAKLILLVRHGAETCQSVKSWSEMNGLGDGENSVDWWGKDDRKWKLLVRDIVMPDPAFAEMLPILNDLNDPVDKAALEWIVSMREALRLRDSKSPGTLIVRYEDLVSRPEEIIAGVCDFCGLDQDDTLIAYGKSVLLQPARRPAPEIHPALIPFFNQTLQELGYQSDT